MDNASLRKDEIEALSAIYGSELTIEDGKKQSLAITLSDPDNVDKCIKLDIVLRDEYPLHGRPTYMISAPWMSSSVKKELQSDLERIFTEHFGESIVFMIIEKAKEYLDKNIDDASNLSPEKSVDENKSSDENQEEEYILQHQCDHYRKRHNSGGKGKLSKVTKPTIYHGEPVIDRRSVFQAHLAGIDCVELVKDVLDELKANKKIASATHNIVAYRITAGTHSVISSCDDDGETHAGSRLLHLLSLLNVNNVVVVVSRWYGGVNLGADRFKHINNVARDLLCKCGYVENDPGKKQKPKGGKKR